MRLSAILLFTFLLSSFGVAQDKLAFEVATIKPSAVGGHGMSVRAGQSGTIIFENFTLRHLIMFAYDVKEYSLTGPSSLDAGNFDVNAKAPAGATRGQMKPMMQALLAERFKLEVHRETKTINGYGLLVAPGGLKIKESPPSEGAPGSGRNVTTRYGQLDAKQVDMGTLADTLSMLMDRPVEDMTELKGIYDVKMDFTPEARMRMNHAAPDGAADNPSSDAPGPSIVTALQEQLGLRVQSRKVTVEALVVDKFEKMPTEN
jgi:uncharacterized protein (TIGR03435 family)